MKYATPMLGLAILVASVIAAAATPAETCDIDACKPALRIPAQYRGEWCTAAEGPTGPKKIYKRCGKSAVWDLEIRAWRFFTPDVSCKVIKITKLRIGHRIQLVCEGETENGAGNEHWRLSADGRLIVSDL